MSAALPPQVDPALFLKFVSMTPRVAWSRPFEIASTSPAFDADTSSALEVGGRAFAQQVGDASGRALLVACPEEAGERAS
jgi:hypothetical protein